MKNKLTIAQVVKDLNNLHYHFFKIKRGLYEDIHKISGSPSLYTSRDLYRLHKSLFEKGTGYKKLVKKLSNGKDRAAKREKLAKEKYDDIPSKKPIKNEDIWGFD